ncbi:MAG: AAA family ATPase [Oscillibacter sp.]|nr:AAA family ATPase [Oscillibacter sp.]
MEIRLHRIGMIEDSEIKLDGLTVITGENQSGKTTIGKALYALVDTVSDLPKKAKADRDAYILKELENLSENSTFFRFLFISKFDGEDIDQNYPALSMLASRSLGRSPRFSADFDPEMFAHNVEEELTAFLRLLEAGEETQASNPWLTRFLSYYSRDEREQVYRVRTTNGKTEVVRRPVNRSARKTKPETPAETVARIIRNYLNSLQTLFEGINGDPLLEGYFQNSLNSAIRAEFDNEIQPIRDTTTPSEVSLSEGDSPYIKVKMQGQHVVESMFHEIPWKKAYFVDNSIALDTNFGRTIISSSPREINSDSYVNPRRFRRHVARLSAILRGGEELSPIEQLILDEKLAPLKAKINAVVPGTFDFSGTDEVYVFPDGYPLHLINLASGSKMFSIMKILLEKGLLDENTMLILDEPEVHLHPEWQNRFAEVIVLLVKELHINVLLTTHSSNFMLALDAYVRKYEIRELANFYQARRLNDEFVTHDCVTNRMEVIYQDFVKPLAEMDVLRDKYADDDEDGDGADAEECEGGDGET